MAKKIEKKIRKVKKTKQTKPVKPTQYLLKKGERLYLVPEALLNSLPLSEAYQLAVIAKAEQRDQLMFDAQNGDQYIEGCKVVDGLAASLTHLHKRFPALHAHLEMFEPKNIGKC